MTGLVLPTKDCSKCGETKPISGFYLQNGKPRSWCRDCERAKARENAARRRAEMGEKAWLASQAEAVRRSRERTGGIRNKAGVAARYRATATLIERHRAEFDALLRIEKYEAGLL